MYIFYGRMAGVRGRVTYPSPPPRRAKASRLGDFCAVSRRFVAPSPLVQAKIGPPEQLFLAFYVDTDAVEDGAHAVRIAWAVGSAGELEAYKQLLVQPRGEIQPSASEKHGVTTAIARDEGASIERVLNEFLSVALEIGLDGGRLLAHDLARHGAIVENELGRCSMTALQLYWRAAMRKGICLMDEEIGRWLLECHSRECTQKPSSNALPLNQVLHLLLPEHIATPGRGHTAVESAAVFLKIARVLHELTVPPCRRPGGRHVWQRAFDTGMRDNGEYCEICCECGRTL